MIVFIAALSVCATAGLVLPSPASNDRHPDEPDGMLVLAVLSPERVMVADPRTGATSARRLAGGTLCHGPVLAIGDRVILSGSRRGRPVTLSLPLTLRGRARSLGAADTFTGSPTRGQLWLGRTTPRSFRGGWLIAARGPRFAWCRGRCRRLRLWSRRGERTLDPPEGLRPDLGGRAAFSPDGRRVAVPVESQRGARVGVIDLTSDTWNVLAPRLSDYRSIAWSPSGRWLYLSGADNRLFAWRLGSARPVRLPIRPGGTVMSIAASR